MSLDDHITWIDTHPPSGHWKWIYNGNEDRLYAWHVDGLDGGPFHQEMLERLDEGIDENLPLIDIEELLVTGGLLCGSAQQSVISSFDLARKPEISARAEELANHAAATVFTK